MTILAEFCFIIRCGTIINVCASNPCAYGGTCIQPFLNSYSCKSFMFFLLFKDLNTSLLQRYLCCWNNWRKLSVRYQFMSKLLSERWYLLFTKLKLFQLLLYQFIHWTTMSIPSKSMCFKSMC